MSTTDLILHFLALSSAILLLPYIVDIIVLSVAHLVRRLSQAIGVENPPRICLDAPFVRACHILTAITLLTLYAADKAEYIARALAHLYAIVGGLS